MIQYWIEFPSPAIYTTLTDFLAAEHPDWSIGWRQDCAAWLAIILIDPSDFVLVNLALFGGETWRLETNGRYVRHEKPPG